MQELTITKNALERIKLIQEKEGNGFLRITVDGGGCSGFSYSFNFDNKTTLFKINQLRIKFLKFYFSMQKIITPGPAVSLHSA